LRDISGRRLLEQFLVRRNTASEKVLRKRSARGPTLLYDLRFRHNTVHCVTKFGSLLGLHALKTLLPGVETCSVALTNGLFDASNRDILLILQDTRVTTGSRRKTVVLCFRSEGSTGRSRPVTWARSRAYHSGSSDHLSDARTRKSRPRRVFIRPVRF
jgi:hypothetical protein